MSEKRGPGRPRRVPVDGVRIDTKVSRATHDRILRWYAMLVAEGSDRSISIPDVVRVMLERAGEPPARGSRAARKLLALLAEETS